MKNTVFIYSLNVDNLNAYIDTAGFFRHEREQKVLSFVKQKYHLLPPFLSYEPGTGLQFHKYHSFFCNQSVMLSAANLINFRSNKKHFGNFCRNFSLNLLLRFSASLIPTWTSQRFFFRK
jgi:hypothetical protein